MAPTSQADTSTQRGTKRKRSERSNAGRPPVKRDTPEELIGKKLHHGVLEVRKAAKKAAAFELRKLVKRLKAARGEKPVKGKAKEEDAAELERQLEVLKHIDHEPFANTALKTKILKDRLLAENDAIRAAITEKLSANLVQPQPAGSSAAKVHGRLLSSKTIADVVHAVVLSLKEILDPSLAKGKANAEQEAELGEDESENEEEEAEIDALPVKGKKARLPAADDSGEGEEDDSSVEAQEDEAGWESGTVDGGDDDGAGWESGSIDGGEPHVAGSSDEGSDSDEEGDAHSGDDSGDEEAPVAKKAKPKAKTLATKDTQPKSKVGESTFLPSLSVGFTRGDSDASDLSDAEREVPEPRKNRRGQRARRAIWEKKFGRNANHVKNGAAAQQQDARQRKGDGKGDKGARSTAPPRGKVPSFKQRGNAPAPAPVDGGWPKRTGGAGASAGAGAGAGSGTGAGAGPRAGGKSDDKPLHPSWEAKKRLKEKLNPSIIPATGKKIKFS